MSTLSGRPARPPKRSAHHHGTHRQLLDTSPVDVVESGVDAIIVPTARNAATLTRAVELAEELDSTLVALCSKWSSARDVAVLARGRCRLIAVDVGELPAGVIPAFKTCQILAGTKFARWTDLSLKRNLGLLLARLIGWERVFFLDDDIEIPEPADLLEAAGLTEHYAGVGLKIDEINGMPDNSMVCHAYRAVGGRQDTFIGGGALAVATKSITSFFPNIYNEDWFFLLGDKALLPARATGTAVQKPYDPFREHRARMEELGDVLAEGLFWLLDTGQSLKRANEQHWQNFLRERAGFITDVIDMVEHTGGDPEERRRMLLALRAARGRSQLITPDLCVRYVKAWREDRTTWRRHVAELHSALATDDEGPRKRRSVAEVRQIFRSLDFPDSIVRLQLPREDFHHDLTDFDVPYPIAVGQ